MTNSIPTILIIDTDAHLARLYSRTLRHAQYRVTVATHLANAQAMLDMHAFDIVIIDLHMDDDGGLGLLREYHPRLTAQGTRLIVMSDDERGRVCREEVGIEFCLSNPVLAFELERLVNHVAERISSPSAE